MRALHTSVLILASLLTTGQLNGQIFATNTAGVVSTNTIGQTQAIIIGSHLTKGMKEEDAKRYLAQNGLGWSLSFGSSFGWHTTFPLTNGGSLCLDIQPKNKPDVEWVDGVVQAAFIQSNGVQIETITLSNAP